LVPRNQYAQQVAWRDQSRAEDATIEVVPTLASLDARRRLLLARSTRDGRLIEHVIVRTDRRALLRLPGTLDSRAVDAYQAWLASL
jgi:hypothetical protein